MYSLTEQQYAALDHNRHISLTANAGSGKTFVLAKRFLSILIEENVDISSIVAITFTDKAAKELYKRIAKEIDLTIAKTQNEQYNYKLEGLRKKLISSKISTIHSFCTEILKEFPAEANIDTNFIPIDQRVANELIQSSIDEVIQNSIRKNDGLLNFIKENVRIFGSRKMLQSVLVKMIYQRDAVRKIEESVYVNGKEFISRFFREKFEEYFNSIFANKMLTFSQSIKIINNRVKENKPDNELANRIDIILNNTLDNENILNLIEFAKLIIEEAFIKKGTVKNSGYLTTKIREGIYGHIERVEEFYSEFKIIEFSDNYSEAEERLAIVGKNLLKLWKAVLTKYNNKKAEKGYLDFEDLLLYTESLVKRDDVKTYLAERYKFFMVDEYQDTNETQYNIFIPILDYLKKGNLFIVGDEKQSIYMFRGADLQVFEKTKKEIEKASNKESLLQLPHSFRLSKEITLFTNELFTRLFENPNLLFNEVKYDNLIFAKNKDTESEIGFLISDGSEECDSENRLIAKKIIQLVEDGKAKYKDIAILTRRRKSFVKLEKELQSFNIPYQIYGGKGFYQRQEVYDVYNYLRFLSNPKNDDALIAILRSPFFTLSDRNLFKISNSIGESFFEKFKNIAKTNDELLFVLNELECNIQLSKSKQISVLIRNLLQKGGYWAKVSTLKDKQQIFVNLDKLINQSILFASKGANSLFDFINYLKESIEKEDNESQAVISDDDSNVKLMTIHGAKGLEFPVVFLIDTNNKPQDDRVKSKSISIDKNFGILTKTNCKNYADNNVVAPIVGIYNFINIKKSLSEYKRLLYVAVTRAENYLFISATLEGNKEPTKNSFLDLIKVGLGIDEFSGTKKISKSINSSQIGEHGINNSKIIVNLELHFNNTVEIKNQHVFDAKSDFGKKLSINTKMFKDTEVNEIISASKISVYNQCPFKYNLVYDIGYTSLFYKGKETDLFPDFEIEDLENNIEIPANIQGTIVHKILEENVRIDKLDSRIEELILSVSDNFVQSSIKKIKTEIKSLITNYYNSDKYREICSYKNFENEFEIYIKYLDFYLYGIIDKIIFDKTTVYIIDYKTDSLKKYTPSEKLESYKYQLMFYAYLVSKMKPYINKYICQLVFIEKPNEKVSIELSSEDLKLFEKKMIVGINSMRRQSYNKNISHCKSCYFSDENYKCII